LRALGLLGMLKTPLTEINSPRVAIFYDAAAVQGLALLPLKNFLRQPGKKAGTRTFKAATGDFGANLMSLSRTAGAPRFSRTQKRSAQRRTGRFHRSRQDILSFF
jgi:hypothetical protein